MALSLNPADVFRIFFERNDKNLARTIAYMEAVVQAGRLLAEIWHGTYRQLVGRPEATLIADGVMGWNISPFQQLQDFYKVTSSVLGKYPDMNESFMHGIASLLVGRSVARTAYDALVARSRSAMFLDDANRSDSLQDLRAAVEVIQREVAALEVVLAHFKAVGR